MDNIVKGTPYFTSDRTNVHVFPTLNEDKNIDVVVIGGGITGAIVSYYFTNAGIKNIVIEKNRVGCGSTSITTALLQYELDDNYKDLLQYTTKDKVAKAYKLGLKALDEVKKMSEIMPDFDYISCDSILYTKNSSEYQELFEEYNFRKASGLDVEFHKSNKSIPFDTCCSITSKNGGATIQPYKATNSLLQYVEKKGTEIYESTEVGEIESTGEGVILRTTDGYKVTAKKVVICSGYDIDKIGESLGQTYSTTFNVVTTPINNLDSFLNNNIFRDNEEIYHYLRSTTDNRLIFGGEDIGFNNQIKDDKIISTRYDLLNKKLHDMFPQYDFSIDYKYCGAFASTDDNLGFIGPDRKKDNIYMCLGYGANGVLFAVLGGMFLSEFYKGNFNSDMDLFSVNRFLIKN